MHRIEPIPTQVAIVTQNPILGDVGLPIQNFALPTDGPEFPLRVSVVVHVIDGQKLFFKLSAPDALAAKHRDRGFKNAVSILLGACGNHVLVSVPPRLRSRPNNAFVFSPVFRLFRQYLLDVVFIVNMLLR